MNKKIIFYGKNHVRLENHRSYKVKRTFRFQTNKQLSEFKTIYGC